MDIPLLMSSSVQAVETVHFGSTLFFLSLLIWGQTPRALTPKNMSGLCVL